LERQFDGSSALFGCPGVRHGHRAVLFPPFLHFCFASLVICFAKVPTPFIRHCSHIMYRTGNKKFMQLWEIITERLAGCWEPPPLVNGFLINISVKYKTVVFQDFLSYWPWEMKKGICAHACVCVCFTIIII
jgi:hypothetical protein